MHKLMSVVLIGLILIAAGCTQSSAKVTKAPANPPDEAPVVSGPSSRVSAATGEPSAPASPGALRLTPENTKIEFFGSKVNGSHTGGFKQFAGTIELPGGDLSAAHINVDIDVNSIYTDTPKLTGHLKTPDFFDVKTNPKALFVSQSIEPSPSGEATHKITGNLTMHGVTKPISFPAKIMLTDDALTLQSKFPISRKEFAMNYRPEMVHDEVKITVSAQVPRK